MPAYIAEVPEVQFIMIFTPKKHIMKLVCSNAAAELYDNGTVFILRQRDNSRQERISKKDNPYYPLECVTRSDFTVDDSEYMTALARQFRQEHQ